LGLFCIKGRICRGLSTSVEGCGAWPVSRQSAKRRGGRAGRRASSYFVLRDGYCVSRIAYLGLSWLSSCLFPPTAGKSAISAYGGQQGGIIQDLGGKVNRKGVRGQGSGVRGGQRSEDRRGRGCPPSREASVYAKAMTDMPADLRFAPRGRGREVKTQSGKCKSKTQRAKVRRKMQKLGGKSGFFSQHLAGGRRR